MKTINRMMVNICSDQLEESKKFYTSLFDFRIDYDSDWFIHLISEQKQLEIGIISSKSEIVPKGISKDSNGYYLTLVVDHADDIFEKAQSLGLSIVEPPHDTFYGQRRLLLKDPNGTMIDVSSPIPDFKF